MARRQLWIASGLIGLAGILAAGACGSDRFGASACQDGVDNDRDGKTDWPDDPGCTTPFDTDEVDPGECGDGIDNDKDGFTDWPADPGCATPRSPLESADPRRLAACADGIDNDGDGKTDWPNDPGCVNSHQDDETDPSKRPACSDGIDDDEDGLTDFPMDPGCTSASDDDETNSGNATCGSAVTLQDISRTGEADGEIKDRGYNALTGACGGLGPERVFIYVLGGTRTVDLVASTEDMGTTLDTVIYVRRQCRVPSTELACNDDAAAGVKASRAVVHNAAPGAYFIVVDAFNPGSLGKFKLHVTPYIAKGTPCDPASMTDKCAPGLVCRPPLAGMPASCEADACSDGRDNDGDGKTDYPNDPGCLSASDGTEEDPSSSPECSNDVDDDRDGKTDFPTDPGCEAASDDNEKDECVPGLSVKLLTFAGATGTTAGSSHAAGSCGFFTSMAPEDVYLFKNDKTYSSLTFSTESTDTKFDTIVYVRSPGCGDSGAEIACNDQVGGQSEGPGYSRATVVAPGVAPYYVFVDGNGDAGRGSYRISVSATLAAGEPCDPSTPAIVCETGFRCRGSAGAEICQRAICNDGTDNDGDGKTDFPFDPGCAETSDDDETDPTPKPACGNGVDDDADGLTDYPADPGCTSASDDGELDLCSGHEVQPVAPGGVLGSIDAALTGTTLGTCAPAAAPIFYPEAFYSFVVKRELKTLTVSTDYPETTLDTVLYVRRDACLGGTEVGCNDDAGGDMGSTVTLFAPFPTSYFIVVDSRPPATGMWKGGNFKLTVTGQVALGMPCSPGDVQIGCENGSACRDSGGSNRCVAAACSDGKDNDGDGKTDFPNDPGCASQSDDDEANTVPAPVCTDGFDNDGDGKTDYPADPGCEAASGSSELDTCGGAPLIDATTTGVATGTTSGKSRFTPPCKPLSVAPEAVVYLAVKGALTYLSAATSGSSFDTVLYSRYGTCAVESAGCGGTSESVPIACCNDDRSSSDNTSVLTMTDRPAGNYYFFVDGYKDAASSSGAFKLTVTGEYKPGAACDPAQSSFLACAAGQSCKSAGATFKCQ